MNAEFPAYKTARTAKRTARQCRPVKLDPAYCDVAIRRWEMATGKTCKEL